MENSVCRDSRHWTSLARGAWPQRFFVKRLLSLLAFLFVLAPPAPAQNPADHVRLLRNLVIEKGETAGDVVCFSCSVVVRGRVTGDIVTFGGDVEMEGSGGGDVTVFGGRVRLHPGAKVERDIEVFGGALVRAPQTVVDGAQGDFAWFYVPGQRRPAWRGVLALLGFHAALLVMCYPLARRARTFRMAQTLELRPWWSMLGGLLAFLLITALYWAVAGAAVASPALMKYTAAMIWGVIVLQAFLFGFGLVGLSCRLGGAMRQRSGALAGLIGEAPLGLTISGALLIFLMELIPVAGSIAFAVFVLLAMGATVVSLFGTLPRGAGALTVAAEAKPPRL
jgi:hypothetical protein